MMVRLGGGEREVMRGMIEGVMLKLEKNERLEGLASEVEFAVDGVRRYLMGEGPRVEMSWMENVSFYTLSGIQSSMIGGLDADILAS